MQRIINDPSMVVEDMLLGFEKAHRDIIRIHSENPKVVISNSFDERKKVGIVTGGGSGHKPAFIGYCGKNMVDAVAVGEIFSSPTAKSFYDAIREVDQGMGVVCLYGNYAGDNMNVKMAIDYAEEDGIDVRKVVANDDIASAPIDNKQKRRGVAGEIFMWKVAGAKASLGASLVEVVNISEKAISKTKSIGIGLSPCTIPANGKSNFSIEEGTMEFGIGHHGEPGIKVEELKSAKDMAYDTTTFLLEEFKFKGDEEVAVIISGLGSTPVMELYIFYNEVEEILAEKGITVYQNYVGNYFTSLEMNGVTLSIMQLDDELKKCLDVPVQTMGLNTGGR